MTALNVNQWLRQASNAPPLTPLEQLLYEKGCVDARISYAKLGQENIPSEFLSLPLSASDTLQCFDVVSKNQDKFDVTVVVVSKDAFTSDQLTEISNWLGWCSRQQPQYPINDARVCRVEDGVMEYTSVALSDADQDEKIANQISQQPPAPLSSIDKLSEQFAAWRLVAQEADNASKKIEEQIAQLADKTIFQDADIVQSGIAKLKITKTYTVEKVDQAIVSAMSQMNFSEEEIDTNYTKHPNFWVPAKVDAESLVNLLQYHLKIDARTDARFKDAINGEIKPNINTRVEFLKDLDKTGSVVWDDLIDWDNSPVKAELIREAMSGPTRDLRQSVASAIRGQIAPLADQTGQFYSKERAKIVASEASLPRKKPKSPKK